MSVSYAGINLPTITRELAERIERYISTQDLYPWDFSLPGQGRLGFTRAAERWRTRPPRLGRLSWPSGASRWATAFFVVDSASLASIREVVYAGGKYVPADLFMTHDDEDATAGITASMYMLPARPLIGVAPGDLWLLVLVDQRYFWWQARSGNLSVADGTSWASLYTTLGDLLPGRPSITPDTISADYQTAPAWFSATDEHIPPLLDSVAKCVGQQIVCDLDGTIHAYGYASSRSIQQSNLAEELDILAGGELSLAAGGDTPGFLPQGVQVDFPQVQNSGYTGKVSSSTQALSSLGILSGVQTNADTRVLFHPFSAQLAAGGSWTNQTACQTLAKAYATSYYQSLTSAEDRVLAGIVDWTPEGLEDWIEWTWTAEMASTRIQRLARLTEDMPSLPTSPNLLTWVVPTATVPQNITVGTASYWAYPALILGNNTVCYLYNLDNRAILPPPQVNQTYQGGGFPVRNGFVYATNFFGTASDGKPVYQGRGGGPLLLDNTGKIIDPRLVALEADANGVITWSAGTLTSQIVVAAASPTQYGIVNTAAQTYAGPKTFAGGVTTYGGLTVADSGGNPTTYLTTSQLLLPEGGNIGIGSEGTIVCAASCYNNDFLGDVNFTGNACIVLRLPGSVESPTARLISGLAVPTQGSAATAFLLFATGGTIPAYCVGAGATTYIGQTANVFLADSTKLVFAGGILSQVDTTLKITTYTGTLGG